MGKKSFLILFLFIFLVYACVKDAPVVANEDFKGFISPSYFPTPVYKFENNSINQPAFELGRKLFYDPILSANNTISCGSCHIQTSAFTQHGHSVSHGIFDQLGTRNSPAIMNLAWNNSFMWDGGVLDLDLQPLAPIANPVEQGETMANVLNKLKNSATYPSLFKKAFGSEEITTSKFLKSLSQFMLMCVSNNAKYDSVKRGEAVFTQDEQSGYAIFTQKCNSCHKEPLFTDNSFRNNGLSISSTNDEGRFLVTLLSSDKYKFKIPSLRNLDYTAPFMHDGRFLNIDGVLEHYASQIQQTPNLDAQLQNGIMLSADEKIKLKLFLKTLNDKYFITNKLLSEQ